MKFILQMTFEDCYQELLIAIQKYVNKYGDYMSPYNSCIDSVALKYDGEALFVKQPQTRKDEMQRELVILTLESLLQIPIFFDPNKGSKVEDVEQYVNNKLYQKYITRERGVDAELHFIFYTSLTCKTSTESITRFLSQLPMNLPFVVDVVIFPCEISSIFTTNSLANEEVRQEMRNNLNSFISLKEEYNRDHNQEVKFNNLYFLQNIDEANHALQFSFDKLTKVFGNLSLALLEGYDHIANNQLIDPITTFCIKTFELDKYEILNNWAVNIFRDLCNIVIGDNENNKKIDKEKVDNIFKETLEEERDAINKINSLPNNEVDTFLNGWKDSFKEGILNRILDANLTNAEKDLLLSYFRTITNRGLIELEDFDIEKLSLFDSLYMPFVDQTTDKDNPYTKLNDVILQIQKLKKDIQEKEKRINETKELLDQNYHRDGRWTDNGYQIGDDVFKIHKNDGIADGENTKGLFEEYNPDLTKPLPRNADLKAYFPPIKNQGEQGACSSFSLTSVFEYFLSSELQKYKDMSEAYVYYNARAINGQTDKDEGANLIDVIKGMADKGVCLESLCKYDPCVYDKQPSSEAYEDGGQRKVTSAKRIPVNVETIKAAVNDGYPVVGCFRIFKSLQDNTSGFIPMPSDMERTEDEGFHAMVICGYNDKHCHFIVRNSWGTKFGDNGYCYLPYSYIRDNDLTRYAVAITAIDAKEFIKHEPQKDEFDFSDKDKNIQYAILINMLKEDELRLKQDRAKVKELIAELRKLIEDIKNSDDIVGFQEEKDVQVQKIKKENEKLEKQKSTVTIWDNRLLHIIHGVIFTITLIALGIGIYKEEKYVWITSAIVSTITVVSWVFMSIRDKRKRIKAIDDSIKKNNERIILIEKSVDDKKEFRDKVIQILNAIGDVDSDSEFNRDLLNIIISSLNECYDKISEYLKNHQFDNAEKDVLFPDWYNQYKSYIEYPDFLRRLITDSNKKDVKKTLREIQEEILRKLNNHFDKNINDLYGRGTSLLWNKFIEDACHLKVYAQIDDLKFNKEPQRAQMKRCSFLLSNLDTMVPMNTINKTDIHSESKNRFIFLKIKKVKLNELIIFQK